MVSKLKEIFDFAIQREEEAYGFYQDALRIVRSPGARPIFEELSAQELNHKQLLLGLKSGEMALRAVSPLLDLKLSDYLIEQKLRPEMSYQDILILAIHREEQSYRLYSDLAARASENFKPVLEFLAGEEAKHKLRLEEEYDQQVLKED
jgi:rubrerythrin